MKSKLNSPASSTFLPVRSQWKRSETPDSGRFHQIRGLVFLALTVLMLWLNETFLKPLLMGAIFAIVLHPLMDRMRPWRVSETWKALIITLLFTVSFLIPIGVLVFLGVDAALEQIQRLPGINLSGGKQFSPDALLEMFGLHPWIQRLSSVSPLSEAQILQMISRGVITASGYLINFFQGFLSNLPGVIVSNVVILFALFFLLIDGPKAVVFIRRNSIFGPRQTERLIAATASLCNSVVMATIVSGLVQATLVSIACLIADTPNKALIALLTFIASFLPLIGTAPVTIGLTALSFLSGDFFAGTVFLIFIGLVGISDNIVRPYVLKGGAELHPLVGFVAAFGALDMIGFYGLFIGPVVAGLFFAMLPMITRSYSREAGRTSR